MLLSFLLTAGAFSSVAAREMPNAPADAVCKAEVPTPIAQCNDTVIIIKKGGTVIIIVDHGTTVVVL